MTARGLRGFQPDGFFVKHFSVATHLTGRMPMLDQILAHEKEERLQLFSQGRCREIKCGDEHEQTRTLLRLISQVERDNSQMVLPSLCVGRRAIRTPESRVDRNGISRRQGCTWVSEANRRANNMEDDSSVVRGLASTRVAFIRADNSMVPPCPGCAYTRPHRSRRRPWERLLRLRAFRCTVCSRRFSKVDGDAEPWRTLRIWWSRVSTDLWNPPA